MHIQHEVLGNSITQVIDNARAAGVSGQITMGFDYSFQSGFQSGFYSHITRDACSDADVRFSITTRMSKGLKHVISTIAEDDWTNTVYLGFTGYHKDDLAYRYARLNPIAMCCVFGGIWTHPFSNDSRVRSQSPWGKYLAYDFSNCSRERFSQGERGENPGLSS